MSEEEFTGLPETMAPEAKPFVQQLFNGPYATSTLFTPRGGGGYRGEQLEQNTPIAEGLPPLGQTRLGPMYGQIASQQSGGGLSPGQGRALESLEYLKQQGIQLSPSQEKHRQELTVLKGRQPAQQTQPSQVLPGGVGGGLAQPSPNADPNFVPDRQTQHDIGQLESDVADLLRDPTLSPEQRAQAILQKQQQMDRIDSQRQYRKNSPYMRQTPADKAMQNSIINRNEFGERAKAGERIHSTVLLDKDGMPKAIHEFKDHAAEQKQKAEEAYWKHETDAEAAHEKNYFDFSDKLATRHEAMLKASKGKDGVVDPGEVEERIRNSKTNEERGQTADEDTEIWKLKRHGMGSILKDKSDTAQQVKQAFLAAHAAHDRQAMAKIRSDWQAYSRKKQAPVQQPAEPPKPPATVNPAPPPERQPARPTSYYNPLTLK